ncbi:hypothetical protein VRRI112168_02745 [Vreelandella rituensis]|uniref:Uncharacterized protein n=1 Tax=Vreelandella rituensis TaxID=2282306 RepID=A0A368UBF6_9GAMM|nr:hypothetical protein [Halomonas rituensis]RCV93662.1 hypothetical protein DU506_00465 [Halomonas rituensis]
MHPTSINISGISEKRFEQNLLAAVAAVTGAEIKKRSKINQLKTIAVFGDTAPGHNEHTLRQHFTEVDPANDHAGERGRQAVSALSSLHPEFDREVSLLCALFPELDRELLRPRELFAAMKFGALDEGVGLLALSLWILDDAGYSDVDTIRLNQHFTSPLSAWIGSLKLKDRSGEMISGVHWNERLQWAAGQGPLEQAVVFAAFELEVLASFEPGGSPQLRQSDLSVIAELTAVPLAWRRRVMGAVQRSIDGAASAHNTIRTLIESDDTFL